MRATTLLALAASLVLASAASPSDSFADIFPSNGDGALPAFSLTDMSPEIDFDNIAANAVDSIPQAADRFAKRHLARRSLESQQDDSDDEDEQQMTYHILNAFGVLGEGDE